MPGSWKLGVGSFAKRSLVIALACFAVACRQDMHDAPRYEPLEASAFFANGGSARTLVANTVARGHLREDEQLYTGKVTASSRNDVPDAGDGRRHGARAGALQRVLLAVSRAHRRGQRHDRSARIPAAAVVR